MAKVIRFIQYCYGWVVGWLWLQWLKRIKKMSEDEALDYIENRLDQWGA